MSKKGKVSEEKEVQAVETEVKDEAVETEAIGTDTNTPDATEEAPAVKMIPLKDRVKELKEKAKADAARVKAELAELKAQAKAEALKKKEEREARKAEGKPTVEIYTRFDSICDNLSLANEPVSIEKLAEEANVTYTNKRGEKGNNLKESKTCTGITLKILDRLGYLSTVDGKVSLKRVSE